MQILTINHQNKEEMLIYLLQIVQIEQQQFIHDPWQINGLQDLLKQHVHQIDVIIQHHQVICYCILQQVFDMAEILRIATAQSHQRQGLASQLLQSIFHQLNQQSVKQILLEVREDNMAAIGLYQKLGFWQIAVRKNYYQNLNQSFTNAIVMQKSI